MRKILFRGKRIDDGKWIYGELLRYAGKTQIWEETDKDLRNHVVDPNTVGQFTGMYDQKCTEIFEGDILKAQDYLFYVAFGMCGGVENVQTYVGYMGFHFVPADKKTKEAAHYGLRNDPMYYLYIHDFDTQVIGNIYENPELINAPEV